MKQYLRDQLLALLKDAVTSNKNLFLMDSVGLCKLHLKFYLLWISLGDFLRLIGSTSPQNCLRSCDRSQWKWCSGLQGFHSNHYLLKHFLHTKSILYHNFWWGPEIFRLFFLLCNGIDKSHLCFRESGIIGLVFQPVLKGVELPLNRFGTVIEILSTT